MTGGEVVITGAGLVCPLGDADSTWKALIEGRSAVSAVRGFDASGFPCSAAAQVEGLTAATLGIRPRDGRIMDLHVFMLIKAAREAAAAAGMDSSGYAAEERAFFAGMAAVDYDIEDLMGAVSASLSDGRLDYDLFYGGAYREIYPLWPLGMLNNVGFCQAAIDLGIKGENTVYSPHGDAGALALWEASCTVGRSRAGVALAAGVSEKVSPPAMARAALAGVLAAGGESARCRPFGADRSGTVPGEGCAVAVMERAGPASRRGAHFHAAVAGFGAAFGLAPGGAFPSRGAVSSAMEAALRTAAVEPEDVDLIMACADGTKEGDAGEIAALNGLFGRCDPGPLVYASKGALGDTGAAAPAIDAVLALKMMEEGVVPPTLHTEELDGTAEFRLAAGRAVERDVRTVLINARSRLGQCASLVVRRLR
ncbi:MAG TPA: hypothetical protein ENJ37_09445 [Deltaproteobacteria bacterium]|nr:hypothetical protein [Deltaproteobacteria bacterium]